ncbi:ABC transporter permease [Saezia sanguinis]|uniref:ABC transporter permease n=1 Tax=Saezia sanguinis TaxID=1965230 RepID=UPI0030394407
MNSAGIRELVTAALVGKTAAQDRVYSPRDWPTHTEIFPVLLVSTPFEKKSSLGRNAPQFNTVTTVAVSGRVIAYDKEDGTSGVALATDAVEALRDQIHVAVINNPALMQEIQQFISVDTQTVVDAEGEGHVGQVLVHFHIEYYQGPEDFYPVEAVPLKTIEIKQKYPDGTTPTGLTIELEQ